MYCKNAMENFLKMISKRGMIPLDLICMFYQLLISFTKIVADTIFHYLAHSASIRVDHPLRIETV